MKDISTTETISLGIGFLLTVGIVVFLIIYNQKRLTGRWPVFRFVPKARARTGTVASAPKAIVPEVVQPVSIIEPSPAFLSQLEEQEYTDAVFRSLGIPKIFDAPDLDEELGTPEELRSSTPIDPESAFVAVERLVHGEVGRHAILDMDMDQRKHVIIAGETGNGKTQSQIAMMVRDIRRGAQVFWLNPHLALFNSEDQPTDLRPIKDRFVQVYDYEEILGYMEAFVALIQERMDRYRANEPVGHFIVIYLDEWPGIVQVLGDGVTEAFKAIAREGRKVRIFLNMASQDALVKTIGLESGVRAQFATRLAGRLDAYSWRVLMGEGITRVDPSRRGEWSWGQQGAPQKVQIDPANTWEIAEIAKSSARIFDAIEIVPHGNNQSSEHMQQLVLVSKWIGENPNISNREIARRLWPQSGSGGGTWATRARVLREEVFAVTVTDGAESGVTEPITVTEEDDVTVTPPVTPPVTAKVLPE